MGFILFMSLVKTTIFTPGMGLFGLFVDRRAIQWKAVTVVMETHQIIQ